MCLFPGISSVNTTTNPKVNKDTLYIIINVVLEFMNLDKNVFWKNNMQVYTHKKGFHVFCYLYNLTSVCICVVFISIPGSVGSPVTNISPR